MSDDISFAEALVQARAHAEAGLKQYPYDAIYRTAIDRIDEIEALRARGGTLADLSPDPNLGVMAAKELGNDEAGFAHALHVIQWEIDHSGRG